MSGFDELYQRSIDDPSGFWLDAAEVIDWTRPPSKAIDSSKAPFYRWFPDARLNTCHNALDRHVEHGRASQDALIYESPVTGVTRRYTFRELRDEVALFAGVLRGLGVERGDRVVIYMPMVPEAVVAMLACARLGAVHSVVFGGFASQELAARIDDAQPVVVVSASCGIEVSRIIEYKPILDAAIALSGHKPRHCVVLQRPESPASLRDGDHDWHEAMDGATAVQECVDLQATEPLYILYTSGTTGRPKGVVRDNGGHAVALAWSMRNVYDVGAGDVYWAASDIGWVVGHSYIVYGPLIAGCTTVLYEGKPVGTPDAGAFWRVIAEHGVQAFFTAPTAIRAIKKEDPTGKELARYDTTSLRALFLAGERLDPDTYEWSTKLLEVPVIDHWWQTETGWPVAANPLGVELFDIKPGSATMPMPGYSVRALRDGQEVGPGVEGSIAIRLPLPPGALPTLWNDDKRYLRSYLSAAPGYYMTGDGGYVDEDGYVFVMGRIDDVINVAGHRLSTGAMEEVIASHSSVAECCVIGAHDELKGQLPLAFVVLKDGSDGHGGSVADEVVGMVRSRIGAVASLRRVIVVDRLPKTRSGKILRSTMRSIADGRDFEVPATIDDPEVLTEIAAALG